MEGQLFVPELFVYIYSLILCIAIFFLNWENRKKWYLYVSLVILFLSTFLILGFLNSVSGEMMACLYSQLPVT